ncbi:MAG: fumarylacetoacetate hydrolase family protein [Gemmatimonadetes bacterium]|nr:fumarylacetoacetate hydrolase family protein [Gemmatimonadota bacterium]
MTPPLPTKIVCVGKNFSAHAAELGSSVPSEPLIFLKPPSSIISSGEPIVVPKGVGRVDYEGEIAVRIGTRARHVSEAEAWSVIEGVLPLNDVTARDLQAKDDQWSRAKGFDTFCPIGTVSSVSPDDFPGVTLVTRVNGEERQRAQASEMVFSIPVLIAYITRIMTLEPGDIVSPGTPEGVGPLSPGDEVEVELEGLDILRNPVEGEGDVGS